MLLSVLPESVSAAEPDAGISAAEETVSEEQPSDDGAGYREDEPDTQAPVSEVNPESEEKSTEADETAGEQPQVEESVPEETKEAKPQTEAKQQRTAVDQYTMLTAGQTLKQTTGKSVAYAFKPEKSGWYHLKAESVSGQKLNLRLEKVIYFTQDDAGNEVEHVDQRYYYEEPDTVKDRIMWLNGEEIYVFACGAENYYSTDEYDFSISMDTADISKMEVHKNPTDHWYDKENYEGMQVKITYDTGDYTLSDVDDNQHLEAFEWGSAEHNNTIDDYEYGRLTLVSIDGSEAKDFTSMENGSHKAVVRAHVTSSEYYDFEIGFILKKNNIASLEVVDAKREYTEKFGESATDFKLKVTYNDGTLEKTVAGTARGVSVAIQSKDGSMVNGTASIDEYLEKGGKVGSAAVKVTYQGAETSYDITINENPYESIEFDLTRTTFYKDCQAPSEDYYYNGDHAGDSIGKITLHKKDGTQKTYDNFYSLPDYGQRYANYGFSADGVIISSDVDSYISNGGKTGDAEISLTYCGLSASCPVTIAENPYDHIKVAELPSKTQYIAHESEYMSLDLNGLVIYAYKDAEETEYDTYDWTKDYSSSGSEGEASEKYQIMRTLFQYYIGGHQSLQYLEPGKHDIAVVLMGKKTTFEIEVAEKLADSLTIEQAPEKLTYYAGSISDAENLDKNGLVLSIKDLKGVSKKYRAYRSEDEEYADWYDIQGELSFHAPGVDWSRPGTYSIDVSYMGVSDSFEITLLESPIKSVSVTGTPVKKVYYEYELNPWDSDVDLTGLTLNVQFTDGTAATEKLQQWTDSIEYQGEYFDIRQFWKKTFNGKPLTGENTIAVSVGDKQIDAAVVTVKEDPVDSIKVIKNPERDKYFGNYTSIDLYGLELLITYTDEKTETVNVTEHTDTVSIQHESGGKITADLSYHYETGRAERRFLQIRCLNAECSIDVTADVTKLPSSVIKNESHQRASVSESNPYVLYAFTPEKSGTYHFFSNCSEDTRAELYSSDSSCLGESDDEGEGENFLLTSELTAGNTYYYAVFSYSRRGIDFDCYLSSSVSSLGELDITDYKIISPLKDTWYDFESENIYIDDFDAEGTEYEIVFENNWTNSGKIGYRESKEFYGMPLSVEWKYAKENEQGELYAEVRDDNEIIYKWGEKTFNFPVKFSAVSPVKSLTLMNDPWTGKTIYEYQAKENRVSAGGLSVKVEYNDGTAPDTVKWQEDDEDDSEFYSKKLNGYDITLKWYGTLKAGSGNIVRVSYMGKTLDVPVTLTANPAASLELLSPPAKQGYYPFETRERVPDMYGTKVRIHYSDNQTKDVEWTTHGDHLKIDDRYKASMYAYVEGNEDDGEMIRLSYLGAETDAAKYVRKDFTIKDSTPMEAGKEYPVTLGGAAGTFCIYSFSPSETGGYQFRIQSKGGWSDIYLYNASGVELDMDMQEEDSGNINHTLVQGRTYYFAVHCWASKAYDFTCSITKGEDIPRTAIETADLKLEDPAAGEPLPDYHKTISASGKYELHDAQWYKDGIQIESGTDADYAAAYRLKLQLVPAEEWEFTSSTKITVNGNRVTSKSLSADGILTLYYTFAHTDCRITIPDIGGYSLETPDDTNDTRQAKYGGIYRFGYTKKEAGADEKKLIVKANGNVLEYGEDGYYTIMDIRENIVVTVKSEIPEAGEKDSKLSLYNQNDKLYDVIIGERNKKLVENTKGETRLPELQSYENGSDKFFFGWYLDKDDQANGKGTRFTSKSSLENKEYNLYSKYGSGIFSAALNGKPVNYKILFIDEDNRTKVQVGDGSKKTSAAKVSVFRRALRAITGQNTLEIPKTLDLNNNEELAKLGVDFGDSEVVAIAENAFDGDTDIKEVILPDTIETIGKNAFANCTQLQTVTIPSTVTEIKEGTFSGCTELKNVELAEGISAIQANAFKDCTSLKAVAVPDSVQEIAPDAFGNQDITIYCSEELKKTLDETPGMTAKVVSVELKLNYQTDTFTYGDKSQTFNASIDEDGKAVTDTGRIVKWTYPDTDAYTFETKGNSLIVTPKRATREDETVTIQAKDTTSGRSQSVVLNTSPKDLNSLDLDGTALYRIEDIKDQDWTGKEICPEVQVNDIQAKKTLDSNNYKVSYSNNRNPGTAIVTVEGTGNYSGTLTAAFKIVAKRTITASDLTKTFGDRSFKLNVTVSGDGPVTYTSKNKNVANVSEDGTVTITGAGKTDITIQAAGTDKYAASEKTITLTVRQQDCALTVPKTSYQAAYGSRAFSLGASSRCPVTYTSSNNAVASVANGTVTVRKCGEAVITLQSGGGNYTSSVRKVTVRVTPKKTTIGKVKNKKGRKLVVTWKKRSEATGYVIEYSTRKDFKKGVKKVTVKKNKTKTATIRKLKKGKKYYVRIRAYTKAGGRTIYGNYSKALKATVRK